MAKSIDSLISFSAGEFSPKTDARIDNEKYRSAMRQCLNMIPLSQGPITRRPGFQYINNTKNSTSAFATRLMKFIYSPDTTFMLEFGHQYIRFYSNGVQVSVNSAPTWVTASTYQVNQYVTSTVNGLIYRCILLRVNGTTDPSSDPTFWQRTNVLEMISPYSAAITTTPWNTEVFGVQGTQINDVVYLVHPNYAPWKLTRLADTVWTMAPVVFDQPATLDQNVSNILLTPSSTIGTFVGMTASAPAWASGTNYPYGTAVEVSSVIYTSTAAHLGSGTFAAELSNGLWSQQAIFQTGHNLSTWIFQSLRPSSSVALNISANATSSTLPVKGPWTLQTSEIWSADIAVQRSYDNGATWSTVQVISSRGDSANATISGTESIDSLYRIVISNWTTVTSTIVPRVVLTSQAAFIPGTFQVVGVTAPTTALVNIIDPLYDTNPSKYWSEGAWSTLRGFPTAVTSFQQRLIFGGTAYQPQRLWMSQTDDLENFALGDQSLATDSVTIDLAAQGRGPILWLLSQVDLFVGLSGAEWVVNAGGQSQGVSLNNAITPSVVSAVEHSNWGSAAGVQPHVIGEVVAYCQRQGTNIRQMLFSIYTQKYMSQELTEMADHLFLPGVVQMDYQPQFRGQGILWAVTQQGLLCGMSYDMEREVFGWAHHSTGYGGTDSSGNLQLNDNGFESVCVIDGKGQADDEVWVVVNRNVGPGHTPTRSIERMSPYNWESVFTAAPNPPVPVLGSSFYVDGGMTFNTPGQTQAILANLASRWVVGLADGVPFGPVQVSGFGVVPWPTTVLNPFPTVMTVGLAIPYACQPMKIDFDPRAGSTQGLNKALSDIFIRVMNSAGGSISNGGPQQPVPIKYLSQVNPLLGPQLVKGPTDIRVQPQVMAEMGPDPVFIIQGSDVLPLTILALILKYSIESTP